MKPSTARTLRRMAQVRREKLLRQFDQDHAATRLTATQEDSMDPHSERLNAHLRDLDEADQADARVEEYEHLRALVEIGNRCYYALNTAACTPDTQPPHLTHQSHNPSTLNA